jgi:hypothetical protein
VCIPTPRLRTFAPSSRRNCRSTGWRLDELAGDVSRTRSSRSADRTRTANVRYCGRTGQRDRGLCRSSASTLNAHLTAWRLPCCGRD